MNTLNTRDSKIFSYFCNITNKDIGMATFSVFKCKKCGYSVHTESQGHYALMSGEYYNFKCNKCNGRMEIDKFAGIIMAD